MGYAEVQDRGQMQYITLEDMVEPDSIARVIDRYIDICPLEDMGFQWAGGKTTGRPAYPMNGLAKLYVYGYAERIRSSRKLETETHRNIEVMWLTGNLTPDHKTIAEFRRKNIRPLQKLYRKFVSLCKDWDLVGGELTAVDGTKIKASNNKKLNFSRKKLVDRLKRVDEQIEKYLLDMEKNDIEEDKLNKLKQRKELYEGYVKRLDETGENELSAVDPDARLMGNNRGGVEVSYNVQSAVDSKHDIIIEYDVSMNPSDQGQLGSMVRKIKKHWKLKRFTVLADKGYYNGEDLARIKRYKVKAIVSRQKPNDPIDQDAAFYGIQFIYDKQTDSYTCPKGNKLVRHTKRDADRIKYNNQKACSTCSHLKECARGKTPFRTVHRGRYAEIYEESDKRFEENKTLYKRRQEIVEHPFGTVKFWTQGYYFLLRTRRKVRCEVALLFLGYNLKRAIKVLGFDGIMARLALLFTFCSALLRCLCPPRYVYTGLPVFSCP